MRILGATTNKNKLLELQTVGRFFSIEVDSPECVQRELRLGPWPEVEENEGTYEGNATQKAVAFQHWSGLPSLGDDSGLEIAALGNKPGVHSKRYAGDNASDRDRITKVLNELNELEKVYGQIDRSAAFHCALVLAQPDGTLVTAAYTLSGHVLHEPRGTKGFGYDPIIFLDALSATLSEVDFTITCDRGFRAGAAKILFAKLSQKSSCL